MKITQSYTLYLKLNSLFSLSGLILTKVFFETFVIQIGKFDN